MPDLSALSLQVSYHKGRDDIARDFYLPCMERSQAFDRAVGYFRSTAFIIAWPALRGFIRRQGKIRVLCSQVLADDDVIALEAGYAGRADEYLEARLREEVSALLGDDDLRAPSRVLAGLVANGTLDLQIAVLRESDAASAKARIFHDKLGIFRDSAGNRVIFKGSMNETWSGLAVDGNLESVDVAASWLGGRDLDRCKAEEDYFEDLWQRRYPDLLVRPFPDVAREELRRAAPADLDEALDALERQAKREVPKDARGRTLKSHQSLGLASWRANGRRGILAFATGAGKTFTAITAIREAMERYANPVVVLVPDTTLFRQWNSELKETLADLDVRMLRAGAGHSKWRPLLRQRTAPGPERRLVLATLQTASSDDFRERLASGSHLLLVADEVHRLGSPKHRKVLDEHGFGPRLGLSATPERFGDPAGTNAILQFFGGILHPRYTLEDAIRDNVLTPYFYRPHAVELSAAEAEEWHRISTEIARLQARLKNADNADLGRRLEHALFARARIVKQAGAKIALAHEVLKEQYREGERWLVYCDDVRQLEAIENVLTSSGLQPLSYHSAMEGGRAETLRWLERRGGVVTAIKCLDEGVDIPSVTHALILASSKNPREFVQRRGRVLRRAPGKVLAHIHDAIVIPPPATYDGDDEDDGQADAMTAGEIARAIEFATYAANPAAAAALKRIAVQAGIDWTVLRELGIEDAED
jgi:superfamily II DNA or RNA helicase